MQTWQDTFESGAVAADCRHPPALLERDTELRAGADAIVAARHGNGSIVLVIAEAGIGKSALATALAQRAGAEGLRVLRGGCENLSAPHPFGPLREIAGRAFPALAAGIDAGAPAAQVFDMFLAQLTTPHACSLVVLEDLHWADAATLDWVRWVGRRIASLPVALLLTARDDEVDGHLRVQQVLGDLPAGRVRRLEPRPLSPAAVDQLAAQAQRPSAGVHGVTGGNPFYVTEILASGLGDASAGVPSSVRDAVQARVARIAADQRAVLDALCVVPGPIEAWLVKALLGDAMAADVDACIARGFLVAQGSGLGFRHELARRTLVDALLPLQRQQRNAAVLRALRRGLQGAASAPLPWSRLAQHASEAGDAAGVQDLAPRAAQQAAARGAHREAAQQLALALRHADTAPPDLRAQWFESWSHESAMALVFDDRVVEARQRAIALWRELGRPDKVSSNLRGLSQLHGFRGEGKMAEHCAEQAVATLEALPLCAEHAWVYGLRSQLHMLSNRSAQALVWGQRAIGLARRFGEPDVLCHALTHLGTAELMTGDATGQARLEQSLAIALDHGLHEAAARACTHGAELALVTKRFACAERWLHEGLRLSREQGLQTWTHRLAGNLARLRLEQGRFGEAQQTAQQLLAAAQLPGVMQLPALTVLARLHGRRGETDAQTRLAQALTLALPTGDAQRIVPLATALAEQRWLLGDGTGCAAALHHLDGIEVAHLPPWQAGEWAVWRRRSGAIGEPATSHAVLPWRLEMQGRAADAADRWLALGAPYEAALALLQAAQDAGAGAASARHLAHALTLCERIGAHAGAARARALGRQLGAVLPHARRGPYMAARAHPFGLSTREQQVLAALARRLRNAGIAAALGLAERTVEHHVSAVLRKMGASDRTMAVDLARQGGLLPAGGTPSAAH